MTRIIFYLLTICIFKAETISAQKDEYQILMDLRENLPVAFRESKICTQLISKYSIMKPSDPVLKGYIGALYIAKSRHSPILNKMNDFNLGKNMLEGAISSKGNDLELLFLRLTIQINLPIILNYKQNISEDKVFVLKHCAKAPPLLRMRIGDFVKNSKHFTPEEKLKICN